MSAHTTDWKIIWLTKNGDTESIVVEVPAFYNVGQVKKSAIKSRYNSGIAAKIIYCKKV